MRKIKTTNRGKNTNKKTRPRNKVESKSPENSRSERERVGWPTGTYLLSTMTTTTTKKTEQRTRTRDSLSRMIVTVVNLSALDLSALVENISEQKKMKNVSCEYDRLNG